MKNETGEVCESCQPIIVAQRDEIDGHLETIRSQSAKLGKARREDVGKKAREHEYWDRANDLFRYWQRATGHTRSRFTPDRFFKALPFLNEYEDEMIERAIDGLAYDPYTTPRRNGTYQRHDSWELLFKSADKLEEFANRAPLGWTRTLEEDAAEVEARR